MKTMEEALLENLSNLINVTLTYGQTLMIASGLDLFSFAAGALILVLLAVRIVKRKRSVRKSFGVRNSATSGRSPTLKSCPNCAERLALSAIICEACDYNFLAERPGRGQKLLPSPNP
jgi:hypothetical protein